MLLVLGVVLLVLALSPQRASFFKDQTQFDLWRQIGFLGVFAIGEAIVIMTGGIDLSLGSLIAFTGMLCAWIMTRLHDGGMSIGGATTLGILAALTVALLVGLSHGTLIQKLRLPPFVVTLASLSAFRSIAKLLNEDTPITVNQFDFINWLGNEGIALGGIQLPGMAEPFQVRIPWAAVILVIIAVIAEMMLRRARIGRYVYSVGSNEDAARLSGVSVLNVKLFAYGASALLAGVAALMFAGYDHQGSPSIGVGYELNAVAAAVIGGCSLTGGRGTVFGTILGACLLQVILSAINLSIANPSRWEGLVVGGVVLLAVLSNVVRQKFVDRK